MATNGKPDIELNAEDNTAKAFRGAQSNLRNLASSAAVLEGPLGQVAGRINAIGAAIGRMNPLMLAAGIGISALVVGLVKAVRAASELEQTTFRLNAVLKATQGAAGLTAGAIDDLAYSVAESTLASQEGARNATIALTSFSNISGDVFKRTLKLAQNHVSVFGGDLVAATIKFARALDAPREGLQGLSRQYTAFNSIQRQLISSMFEAGDVIGAQEKILGELEARIGGAGVAAAGGLAGAVDTFHERIKDLLATLGRESGALEQFTWLFNTLARGAGRIQQFFDPDVEDELADVKIAIQEVYDRQTALSKFGVPRTSIAFRNLMDDARELTIELDRLKAIHEGNIEAEKKAKDAADALAAQKRREKEAVDHLLGAIKQEEAAKKAAAKVEESTLTPLEKRIKAHKRLRYLVAEGGLSPKAAERQFNKIEGEYDKFYDRVGKAVTRATTSAEDERTRIILEKYDSRENELFALRDQLGKDEVTQRERINAALLALEEKKNQELAAMDLQRGLQVANNAADVLGSISQIQSIESQRQLESVNGRYEAQAAAIEEQVNKETLTRAQGDAKLRALEARRQKDLESGAKKQFESSKKFQRAQALLNTAAAVTGAMADTHGPIWVRIAAATAAAAAGAAQIAAINATSFNGGGGVGPSGSPATAAAAPDLSQKAEADRGALTIQFIGDFHGWDDYIQDKVVNGIRSAVKERDVILIDANSRQAAELKT